MNVEELDFEVGAGAPAGSCRQCRAEDHEACASEKGQSEEWPLLDLDVAPVDVLALTHTDGRPIEAWLCSCFLADHEPPGSPERKS